MHMYIHSDITK